MVDVVVVLCSILIWHSCCLIGLDHGSAHPQWVYWLAICFPSFCTVCVSSSSLVEVLSRDPLGRIASIHSDLLSVLCLGVLPSSDRAYLLDLVAPVFGMTWRCLGVGVAFAHACLELVLDRSFLFSGVRGWDFKGWMGLEIHWCLWWVHWLSCCLRGWSFSLRAQVKICRSVDFVVHSVHFLGNISWMPLW